MRLACCDLFQVVILQFGVFAGFLSVVGGQVGRYKKCDSISVEGTLTPGQCIEFPLCPRLLEFAKRPEKSVEDFRVLRQLTCGFYKDKPRVSEICCPDEDIYHPPAPEDTDYSNFRLEFPKERDHNSTNYSRPDDHGGRIPSFPRVVSGSPDVSYSTGSIDQLIPKLEDCGEPRFDTVTSTRIIGGSKAQPGQFPYMALLYRIDTETDEEEYYCAGTIINQFYILTAAHCVLTNQNTTTLLAFILVGITNVNERCHKNNQRECLNERRYEVKETIVHPKYIYGTRDRSHDIALVRTALPIELDKEYIRPVCLPIPKLYGIQAESFQRTRDGNKGAPVMGAAAGIVAGWGKQSNSGPQNSPNLKSVILPILSKTECQQRYTRQTKISEKQICAGGEPGRDTCVGDSGGPLLTPFMPDTKDEQHHTGKMFQIGIVSYGPALCAINGKPSVYTSVISYIDWILDNMYL